MGFLLVMLVGFIIGFLFYKLQKYKQVSLFWDKVIMIVIYTLLFFIGVDIGSNKLLMRELEKLGYIAFLYAFFAVGGTIIVSFFVYNLLFKEKNER